MNYLLSMLAVLVTGMAILITGIILMNKRTDESPYAFQTVQGSVVKDSLAWGGSLFLSFGVEFLVLAKLL